MTDISTEQAVTLSSIYSSGLVAFMKRETRFNAEKYSVLLKKAKFPADRKAKLRAALGEITSDYQDHWLKVFSILMGDKSIADPAIGPSTFGTCIVITNKVSTSIANGTVAMSGVVSAKTAILGYINDGRYYSVYHNDSFRYATDDEIEKYVSSITPAFLNIIRTDVSFAAIHKFAESQLVIKLPAAEPDIELSSAPEVEDVVE